jgi:hypothetical protein
MNYMKMLLAAFLLFGLHATAQEADSYWKFRRTVTVKNRERHTLEDYQVSFTIPSDSLVLSGRIRADRSDIRIVDQDMLNPLCFWTEEIPHRRALKVWVKIPRLAPGAATSIHFLYGNMQAERAEDAECTFLLFDDFKGDAVDRTKWELMGTGEPLVKNGRAGFRARSTDQFLLSRQEYDRPLITEMKTDGAESGWLALAQLIRSGLGWVHGYSLVLNETEKFMQIYKMQPSVCGAYELPYPHSMHRPSLEFRGVWSLSFITDNEVMASWPGGDIIEGNVFNDAAGMKVGVGVLACGNDSGRAAEAELDWVRIRKHTANEPSVEVGEEEQIQLILPSEDKGRFLALAGEQEAPVWGEKYIFGSLLYNRTS